MNEVLKTSEWIKLVKNSREKGVNVWVVFTWDGKQYTLTSKKNAILELQNQKRKGVDVGKVMIWMKDGTVKRI